MSPSAHAPRTRRRRSADVRSGGDADAPPREWKTNSIRSKRKIEGKAIANKNDLTIPISEPPTSFYEQFNGELGHCNIVLNPVKNINPFNSNAYAKA